MKTRLNNNHQDNGFESFNYKNEGVSVGSVKEAFSQALKEKNEDAANGIHWIDDKSVEVSNVSSMALQSFFLKLEKLGKKMSVDKKIIVKIID